MGNRNSGTRRKGGRESAYTYSDNRRDDYSAQKNNNNAGGSINRRPYQTPTHNFQHQHSSQPQTPYQSQPSQQPHQQPQYQHQHSNGYSTSQSALNSSKTNASKVIYVANYDFNGTLSTGELSFHKGDRLEILDRYSSVTFCVLRKIHFHLFFQVQRLVARQEPSNETNGLRSSELHLSDQRSDGLRVRRFARSTDFL